MQVCLSGCAGSAAAYGVEFPDQGLGQAPCTGRDSQPPDHQGSLMSARFVLFVGV